MRPSRVCVRGYKAVARFLLLAVPQSQEATVPNLLLFATENKLKVTAIEIRPAKKR